jgi:hypothetical protein
MFPNLARSRTIQLVAAALASATLVAITVGPVFAGWGRCCG